MEEAIFPFTALLSAFCLQLEWQAHFSCCLSAGLLVHILMCTFGLWLFYVVWASWLLQHTMEFIVVQRKLRFPVWIWDNSVFPTLQQQSWGGPFLFQHDNASLHKARSIKMGLACSVPKNSTEPVNLKSKSYLTVLWTVLCTVYSLILSHKQEKEISEENVLCVWWKPSLTVYSTWIYIRQNKQPVMEVLPQSIYCMYDYVRDVPPKPF